MGVSRKENTRKRVSPYRSYQLVENDLRRRLGSGEWAIDIMLPSRRDLARHYGVDINTLQRAITPLMADGLLRSEGSRGTFVNGQQSATAAVGEMVSGHDSGRARPWSPQMPEAALTLGVVGCIPEMIGGLDHREVWPLLVMQSIERTWAHNHGAAVQFVNRNLKGGLSLSIEQALESPLLKGVHAVILIFQETSELTDSSWPLIVNLPVPIIFVGSREVSPPARHVRYDSFYDGHRAAEHLIKHGYRDLVFMDPFQMEWGAERLSGVRRAVDQWPGVSLKTVVTRSSTIPHDQSVLGFDVSDRLLRSGELSIQGAGIVAVNDAIARGLMLAARDNGLEVGQDYGIVGFDDRLFARGDQLTSLRPPLEEMGRQAALMAMSVARGDSTPMQVSLRSHLIPRTSSRPLAVLKARLSVPSPDPGGVCLTEGVGVS